MISVISSGEFGIQHYIDLYEKTNNPVILLSDKLKEENMEFNLSDSFAIYFNLTIDDIITKNHRIDDSIWCNLLGVMSKLILTTKEKGINITLFIKDFGFSLIPMQEGYREYIRKMVLLNQTIVKASDEYSIGFSGAPLFKVK